MMANWNRTSRPPRPSSNTTYRRNGRRVPCPKCGAKVNQWCIGLDGPRVSNHRERNEAAGLRPVLPTRQTPMALSPDRIALYDAIRAHGACEDCGAAVGAPCLGKAGSPIQSCHSRRYYSWKDAQPVDRAG